MAEITPDRGPAQQSRPTAQEPAGRQCVAFAGPVLVASGDLSDVTRYVREHLAREPNAAIVILDAATSDPIDLNLRGTPGEAAAGLRTPPAGRPVEGQETPGRTGAPGRPRLGVVAREVTLLPRHWEWLNDQPGGASVTLRKLVEQARRSTVDETRLRRSREACHRFMTIMAGNEPGFEEALRALFADDATRFEAFTEQWPPDVRTHARRLAAACLTGALEAG